MNMKEYSGRTVAEAIEAGLKDLGLTTETAQIEVIDEGHSGVFGLGAKPALVRVGPLPTPEEPASLPPASPETAPEIEPVASEESGQTAAPEVSPEPSPASPPATPAELPSTADESTTTSAVEDDQRILNLSQEFLQNMLDLMTLQTRVEAEIKAPTNAEDETVYYLNITGDDLGVLIGRRGETLSAIQFLVRLYVNRHMHYWPRIEIDVESYKQRRTHRLQKLAENLAERAVLSGKTVVLEAMPARERRLIHLALRDRSDVTTKSIGEGDNRKVTIIPKL